MLHPEKNVSFSNGIRFLKIFFDFALSFKFIFSNYLHKRSFASFPSLTSTISMPRSLLLSNSMIP